MRLIIATVSAVLFSSSVGAQTISPQELRKQQQKQMQMQFLMMRLNNIVHNKSLCNELDLVDDQLEDVTRASQNFQREAQRFHSQNSARVVEIQDLQRKGEHRRAQELSMKFQEEMFGVLSKNFEAVEKVLLPHQLKRIKQISRQEVLKNMSGYGDEFGIPLALADEVDLTPAEKKGLEKVIEKARKSYYLELERLKQKTHDEIFKSIPAEKRAEIRRIIGDLFDATDAKRKNLDAARNLRNRQRK